MQHPSPKPDSWLFSAGLLAILSLACSLITPIPTKPAPGSAGSQPELPLTPVEGNAPKPADIPTPTASPAPDAPGMSRRSPYPFRETLLASGWELQALETRRGEAAWEDLQAANMFNTEPPPGMEYLLVRLRVKSQFTDSGEHEIDECDFRLTGDRLNLYDCGTHSVVAPEPRLEARLYTGGEVEGWCAYVVGQGEGSLLLAFDESSNPDASAVRYLALEEGAALGVSPDLARIQPTDLGRVRRDPAPLTTQVISEDWEVSAWQVVRGSSAWQMVQEVNQYNDPPAAGMEYLAVKVQVRSIGTEDEAKKIDSGSFETVGSAGVVYDSPSIVDPEPALDAWLFPGGAAEGWVIVQAAEGETGLCLIFNSQFDFSDDNKRFLSLEQ